MTTLHYQGKLGVITQKDTLIHELKAYAKSLDLKCTDIDDDKTGLSGVVLGLADKMEPVPFIFDAEGRLHSFFDVLFPGSDPCFIASVKTHYAGTDGHIKLVRLLRHIKDQYMPKLKVTDESDYWEHGDEARLKESFAQLDRFAGAFEDHLRNDVVIPADSTPEDRVHEIIRAADMANKEIQN